MVGVSVRTWIGLRIDGEGTLSGIRVYADSTLNAVGTPPMCEYFLWYSAQDLISVKSTQMQSYNFFRAGRRSPGAGWNWWRLCGEYGDKYCFQCCTVAHAAKKNYKNWQSCSVHSKIWQKGLGIRWYVGHESLASCPRHQGEGTCMSGVDNMFSLSFLYENRGELRIMVSATWVHPPWRARVGYFSLVKPQNNWPGLVQRLRK